VLVISFTQNAGADGWDSFFCPSLKKDYGNCQSGKSEANSNFNYCQKQIDNLKTWFYGVSFVSLAAIIGEGIAIYKLFINNQNLNTAYQNLNTTHQNLNNNFQNLNTAHQNLNNDFQKLRNNNLELNQRLDCWADMYNGLLTKFNERNNELNAYRQIYGKF
jgi:hypothetical protein